MLPLSSTGLLVWLESTLSPWSVFNLRIVMLFISWSRCNWKSNWLLSIVLFSLFLQWFAPLSSVLVSPSNLSVQWRRTRSFPVTTFQFPANMFDFGVRNMPSLDPEQRGQAALGRKGLWQGGWKRLLEQSTQEQSKGKGQADFAACMQQLNEIRN